MRSFFIDPFRNLIRGERTAIIAALIGVAVGLVFAVSVAHSQYPYPSQPATYGAPAGSYQWFAMADNKNVWTLWRGNEYIGTLDPDLAKWKFAWEKEPEDMSSKLDKLWKEKGFNRQHTGTLRNSSTATTERKPEATLPEPKYKGKAAVREEDGPTERLPVDGSDGLTPTQKFGNNFGVDFSGVGKDRIGYSINGKPVNAAEAMDAIRDASIPNDTELPRLIVIGNDAARKKVLADLDTSPELAAFKGKLVVQGYPPGHWHVSADRGFVQPTSADGIVIQAQTASGKVLWRQTDYNGGAPELARSLRDKVPGYDPAKDPTPKAHGGSSLGDGWPFSPLWLVAAGAGLFVVWRVRK